MAKLNLSSVTLIMVETLCHDLAKIAVEDCIKHADFGEILIFSDKHLGVSGALNIKVENWPSKLGWSEWLWYGVPEHVKTPQALLLQWDAGICKPDQWKDDFLNFDYIGAPWGWHGDGLEVGNSGFSLRSKRLQDFLVLHRDKFPVLDPEDVAISRTYRPALETQGFKWADIGKAFDFAFENNRKQNLDHFGYHGVWNWAYVLDPDELERRAKLVAAIPYIRNNTMFERLKAAAPHLAFN